MNNSEILLEKKKSSNKEHANAQKEIQSKLPGRHNDELKNPCVEEQNLALKCLRDNLFNSQKKCQLYAENYKLCKAFWAKVKGQRRYNNWPEIPSLEERKQIKEEYLKSK